MIQERTWSRLTLSGRPSQRMPFIVGQIQQPRPPAPPPAPPPALQPPQPLTEQQRQDLLAKVIALSNRATTLASKMQKFDFSLEPGALVLHQHMDEMKAEIPTIASFVSRVVTGGQVVVSVAEMQALTHFESALTQSEDVRTKLIPQPQRFLDDIQFWLYPIAISGGLSFALYNGIRIFKSILGLGGKDEE